MSKSWYSRSQDIEYKDGHIGKEYHLVFETTDKKLARRIEKTFQNIMDGIEAEQIVRCKDCKHDHDCEIQYAAQSGGNFYCGMAERKDDAENHTP